MSLVLLAAVALLVAAITVRRLVIQPLLASRASRIPCAHPTAALSSFWIRRQRRQNREIKTIHAAHQKYGSVVRLAPDEISVASLDGLRTIYVGGFEKDEWYKTAFMNYDTPNLVSMLESKPHSIQKRMISHVYSKSFLQSSPDYGALCSILTQERLLPLLRKAATNREDVNILDLTSAAGADYMAAYLFGTANGTDYLRDIAARNHYFSNNLLKMRGLPGCEAAAKEVENVVLELCQRTESHINSTSPETSTSTNPVVYARLASNLTSANSSLAPDAKLIQVASEMLDHFLAGHETSAITTTYAVWELSRRPEYQTRLREELRTALAVPLTPQSTALPSPQDLDSLPLLDAILRETLRLYAAVAGPQPRVTPIAKHGTAGVVIDGFGIPSGTRISTSAYVLHRNEDVYKDSGHWIPERWLDADQDQAIQMRKWFWAFGSGGRMCIGSNFALQSELFLGFSFSSSS